MFSSAIEKIAVKEMSLVLRTRMMYIKKKPIGEYIVVITYGERSTVNCYNTTVQMRWGDESDSLSMHGPHINQDGVPCMSSGDWIYFEQLVKSGKLQLAAYFVLSLLQETNGHPYIDVLEWPKIKEK